MTTATKEPGTTEQAVRRRVLLVDDDPDYVEGVRIQLQAAGYDVVTADGVRNAEKLLAEQRPDAAVIDLMMEEQDGGFSLCHHIKRLDSTIPVVIVSAVTSETGLDFTPAGPAEKSWIKADALLAKPIRFEQLQRELRRLVKG